MRHLQLARFIIPTIFTVMAGFASAQDGPADAVAVKGGESWSAKHVKREFASAAPKNRVISSDKEWEELWNRWRPVEELPKVDFSKDLLIVATVMGPNTCTVSPTLDSKGNLKIEVTSSIVADDGRTFAYLIQKIPLAGIKTVDGKPFGKN